MKMDFFQHLDGSKLQVKVLNSALELFVEKGYFNTSVPDLVAHSGVSIGSIYKHFGDKQGLAEALVQRLTEEVYWREQQIVESHTGCFERYQALVKWLFQFSIDYPSVMAFMLLARHQTFLPESGSLCSSKPFMLLRDVIAQGIEQGVVRQMDLLIAASLAFGSVLRMVQLHLDGVLPKPLLAYQDELIQSGWSAIATNPNT
ncbi:TetR/AcrR family transcriptional regulator [Thiomicrospira microaerophila]|uniref:TetR/AcrR family transcriptional regulator n=1 Tax=Thiomicrospira microaerophila TaxID=406020 RepID=UPI00200CDF1F|nr:TetR/AcrR family transcriptional regulator [Thiomicrospira microaerophila]UQB42522.1 TetR/AcrR family transcriptional regulator [Thiomicrospira microaerophila]